MNLKKILALVLVLAMLVSMVPTYAFAEDVELWDEEEVAVQDDAALEDVYLDEEPEEVIVEDEPEATEPEAVEVEEPAAEEPAAVEEPVAAAVTESTAVEETNDFAAADDVAMVASKAPALFKSLAAAVATATDVDTITMLKDDPSTGVVVINKKLVIEPVDTARIAAQLIITGDVTLKNLNTTSISVNTGGKLTIAAGDTGSYGTVTDDRGTSATSGFIAGGTFTSLSKSLLAPKAIAENVIDENTVSGKVTAAAALVAEKNTSDNYDYSTDTKAEGFATIAAAVTEALTVETGKDKVLVILTDPTDADAITLNAGQRIQIWHAGTKYLKVNLAQGCYFKSSPSSPESQKVLTYEAAAYGAVVHNPDGTTTPIMDPNNAAKDARIKGVGEVEYFVKPTENPTLATPSDTAKLTIWTNEFAPTKVEGPEKYVVKEDKSVAGKITYTLVEAVASYQKPAPTATNPDATEPVYTETFAEAATEAYKYKNADGAFAVTLYKLPTINDTVKDVYPMGSGTLTVTLDSAITAPEADVAATYVKADGEFAITTKVNTRSTPNTITYTSKAAVAKAKLNQITPDVPEFEYFGTVKAAVKFVVEDHPNDHLVIIPIEDGEFKVAKEDILNYVDKNIRIANGGDKKIKMADRSLKNGNVTTYYAYSETAGEGYTTYTLKPATVKIPATPEMDMYYDTVDGTNTKYFPSFADAIKADSTAVVELIATPTDATTHQEITETFKLGIPDGPTTVKAKLGNFDWLIVKAYDETVAVKAEKDPDLEGVTVYSLADAVASVTFDVDTVNERTELYDNFADAAKAAGEKNIVTLLKSDTTAFELDEGKTLKVEKKGNDVNIVAKANSAGKINYAILAVTDDEGITTYKGVGAAVEINFGTESKPNTKLYARFADAVEAKSDAVFKLVGTPTDLTGANIEETYELGQLGGPETLKVKLNNHSWLKVKPVGDRTVKEDQDTADSTITVYSLTDATASVTKNNETVTYASLREAVNDGNYAQNTSTTAPATINMLKTDEQANTLPHGVQINVKLNGFKVKIVAEDGYAILETLDETTGVTNYKCVDAVASIDFGTEAQEDVKFYPSFAKAVEAAYAPAGTDAKLVIKLLKEPTAEDLYEVKAAGSFLVDLSAKAVDVVGKNLSYAEDAPVVKPAVGSKVKDTPLTYLVKVEGGVASITTGTGDDAVTTFYATFAEAAAVGEATSPAETKLITLYAPVEENYQLAYNKYMKVAKGDFKLNVVAKSENGRGFEIDDVLDTETGITSYTPVLHAASIGSGSSLTFYDSLDDAAKAAGSATITLYNTSRTEIKSTYSYVLGKGENVTSMTVNKNGLTLTVTSETEGKGVKETPQTDVKATKYDLVDSVAYLMVDGKITKYYGMIDKAVADAAVANTNSTENNHNILVLQANVTNAITVPDNKNINIQAGTYTIKKVEGNDDYAIVETSVSDEVTNYKSVPAVASIKIDDETEYYATFAEAAELAYVKGDAEPVLTVNVLRKPAVKDSDPRVIPDLFEVSETGSILIKTTIDVEPNFVLADGLSYDYEGPDADGVYLVMIVEAEAYTIRNNGKFDYYIDVDEAGDKSVDGKGYPVVHLMQDELSYALAENGTLVVNKHGHNDFVVTKATPTELEPKYAIVETVNGDESTYTTDDNVIAYIDFVTTEKTDDEYGIADKHNVVYYTSFDFAASAADSKETIVLVDNMDENEPYVLRAGETLIVNYGSHHRNFSAPVGYAIKEEPVENAETTVKVTLESCVATVNYKWNGESKPATDKPYFDLSEALKDAIAHYDKVGDVDGAYLTLWAPVPADFTYTLGEKDWIRVEKNDEFKFNVTNFVVSGGFFASFEDDALESPTCTWIHPVKVLASIGEGEKIEYFGTFTDVVNRAVAIENESGHYAEPRDPKSVITLYADNKNSYELGTVVDSLLIKAGEHKTGLTAPAGKFVEIIPTNEEGVSLYKLSDIKAIVWSGPNNDRVKNYFSSFASAAQFALNTVETVELQTYVGYYDEDDIFEMPVGTLNVKFLDNDTAKDNFAKSHITVKAERASLYSEVLKDETYLYTVTGAVASITTSRGTSFYYDMGQAINQAMGKAYLEIVPLTDIDYYYVPADSADMTDEFFNVADSEYDVQIRAKGYELAHEGTKYTFKSAVAYVTTEDVLSVNPETNEPTFIDQYFSDIADAIEFAEGKMLITLLQDVEYEFHDASTVAIIALKLSDTATQYAFNRTLSDKLEGYAIKDTVIKEADPRTAKYEVAALQTLTFEASDGVFVYGTNKASQLTFKAYAGASFTGLRALETGFTALDAYQAGTTLTLEGYHVAYLKGSDGNNYALNVTGTLTPDEKAAGYVLLPTTMPEDGLTLTAVWEGYEYWVDYRDQDSNLIKTAKFTYGELLEIPEGVTTKDNYDFNGWFSASSCLPTTAFDVANTKITKDTLTISDITKPATTETYGRDEGYVTVYGKFTPKKYTVKFDTGCDVTIADQIVPFGDPITAPKTDNLKKEGYEFADQWYYVDADGREQIWNMDTSTVEGNVTLIARWTAKQLRLIWADGSYVIQRDEEKNVGTPTDAPDYSSRTNPGYRIDPAKAWIDDDGDLFTGKVPVKDASEWIYRLNWIEQINVIFVDGGKKLGQVTVDKGTTLADAKDVPAPTKEGYTLVWQLEGEDYDVKAPIQEELLLTASWVDGQDVSDYATVVSSLSLRDNINLNGYVTIKENTLPGDYEVKVEFNGKTMMEGTLDTVGTFVESSGEYKLTDIAVIAAPQMNDAAKVTITYQGKEVLSKDLTVRAYAEEWIEKSSNAKLVELLKALLDFGAYSQIQFNYQTNNLANSKYSTGKVPTTVVPVYPVKVDGSVTGITGASTSLTLVSNTALNVYFAVQKTGNYKFAVDGNTVKANYSNKEYKVALENILVADLDTEHVFTATLNGETYTMTCAPLAYAYQHQNDGNALGDVCKAVYVYFDAADAYFG